MNIGISLPEVQSIRILNLRFEGGAVVCDARAVVTACCVGAVTFTTYVIGLGTRMCSMALASLLQYDPRSS